MTKEKTVSSQFIYKGRAVNLRVDKVVMPSGRETTREVVEHSDCIAVVALDNNNNLLLVSQYRQAVDKELLEIPAGGIEPGEDPETATRREMREETGYLPQRLTRLGGFYSAPGYCTEYLHLFLATDLVSSRLFAEDTEVIRLKPVPLNQVKNLITSGTICDAKSIAGIAMFFEYQQNQSP